MSVVIKDMDKPESCESCEFVEGAYYFDEGKKFRGYCHRTGLEIPCECPIIPMLPHGDLIDRDKLIKQARTQFDWNDVVDVEDIINAPTVIPAEESENKG